MARCAGCDWQALELVLADEQRRTVDCMQHLAAAAEVLEYTLALLEQAMQPVDGNTPVKVVALPAETAQ